LGSEAEGLRLEFDQGKGGRGDRSAQGCTEVAHCAFTVERP